MVTKPVAIVTVTMAAVLAAATRTKTRRPSRQLQAKPAPASLRNPTATDRSLQSLRRNGYPSRAIGRWDYDQVWIPNIVYTRHERYWIITHNGNDGPFYSESAADVCVYNDMINDGSGGSLLNDSYTITENQERYEQQATGQHWVVDVAGHWELIFHDCLRLRLPATQST